MANEPTLSKGAVGEAVEDLQTKLKIPWLKIDGEFGEATFHAVKSFQVSKSVAEDGIVGPHTWAALDAA